MKWWHKQGWCTAGVECHNAARVWGTGDGTTYSVCNHCRYRHIYKKGQTLPKGLMLTWILSCCSQWLDSSSVLCHCIAAPGASWWQHVLVGLMVPHFQCLLTCKPLKIFLLGLQAHVNLEAMNFLSDIWHSVPLQVCHHAVTLVQTTVWNHWLDLGQTSTQRTVPSMEGVPLQTLDPPALCQFFGRQHDGSCREQLCRRNRWNYSGHWADNSCPNFPPWCIF